MSLFTSGRLGEAPIEMFGIFGLVTVSARSGEYAPGPMLSGCLSGLFSPIRNDLTLELNLLPSSYCPGPTLSI